MNDYHLTTPVGKPRARALGIPFSGEPGAMNAITDVAGLEVGTATLVHGDAVRTGVTVIHPRGPSGSADPVAAGFHSQNGNGEMTGVSWIHESGTFAGPVGITSTAAVGVVHAAILAWVARHHPQMAEAWVLPVVGETWDGYLHDLSGQHITQAVALAALESSSGGPVEEGSVGGGTGMTCYQYKGGSGTASRRVRRGNLVYTVGVFLQANFGRRQELTVAGVPLGREFADDNPMATRSPAPAGAGSVIAVVATDAPLLPGQLEAMARRVPMGLARTGTTGSHFSGDLCLAFSTANPGAFCFPKPSPGPSRLDFLPWEAMDPLFAAVVYATEEAVLNALVANDPMTGRDGHVVPALPRDRVAARFRGHPAHG
jgi:L-aminopeptidase/D-esterase-like protein